MIVLVCISQKEGDTGNILKLPYFVECGLYDSTAFFYIIS